MGDVLGHEDSSSVYEGKQTGIEKKITRIRNMIVCEQWYNVAYNSMMTNKILETIPQIFPCTVTIMYDSNKYHKLR